MNFDLVLSGNIVDQNRTYDANIGIKNGVISRITQSPIEGKKIALSDSSFIFPGFIDMHVHLRQDASGRWNYKEDFLTGSQAAAHGGVTTVADMPNNPVPATTPEAIMEKINLTKKAIVDILFYGGVSGNPAKLKAMSTLVCGYKIYAGETTGTLAIGLDEIEKAIRIISETGKPVVFHAGEQLKEILSMCENYDITVHIAHVSTKKEIAVIEKYRKKMQLTCEATPHHLYFSEGHMEKLGNLSKVKPPLSSESDRNAVFDAMKKGVIDVLATDHAPHTIEDKKKGASGFPHLDTYGMFVSWLIEKKFPLQRIAQITSFKPAGILGLNNRIIKEGMPANLAVIDMQPCSIEKLYTKCNWSPFSNLEFPGKVMYTIYQGRIIMDNGKIV